MSGSKRYVMLWLASVLVPLAALLSFVLVIDLLGTHYLPVNGWHPLLFNRVFMGDVLDRLRHDRHVLSFGTSRSQEIGPEHVGSPILNLMYFYGNPTQIYRTLDALDPQQQSNITKIYVQVDYLTLEGGAYGRDMDLSLRALLNEEFNNLTVKTIGDSFDTLVRNIKGQFDYVITAYGGVRATNVHGLDDNDPFPPLKFPKNMDAAPSLASIESWARTRNIPIVFYTPVLSRPLLRAIGRDFMCKYNTAVASNLTEIYTLSDFPELTDDPTMFGDVHHLNANGITKLFKADWTPFKTGKGQYFCPR